MDLPSRSRCNSSEHPGPALWSWRRLSHRETRSTSTDSKLPRQALISSRDGRSSCTIPFSSGPWTCTPLILRTLPLLANTSTSQPETIDLLANSDTFIMAPVERTFMGTVCYREPDYQSEIETR